MLLIFGSFVIAFSPVSYNTRIFGFKRGYSTHRLVQLSVQLLCWLCSFIFAFYVCADVALLWGVNKRLSGVTYLLLISAMNLKTEKEGKKREKRKKGS